MWVFVCVFVLMFCFVFEWKPHNLPTPASQVLVYVATSGWDTIVKAFKHEFFIFPNSQVSSSQFSISETNGWSFRHVPQWVEWLLVSEDWSSLYLNSLRLSPLKWDPSIENMVLKDKNRSFSHLTRAGLSIPMPRVSTKNQNDSDKELGP